MQTLLRHLSGWAYTHNSPVLKGRAKRMRAFQDRVKPPEQANILDLGGSPLVWKLIPHDYRVTLVNLPGFNDPDAEADPRYQFIDGDACDLSELFEDQSFDIVFSNSVIEHVGDEPRQAAFAAEVHRLASSHWIQTPSDRFPLEVHTGVPFYWKLPAAMRNRLHRSWQKKLPEWYDMIRETRVLSCERMKSLFPDSQCYREQFAMLEKSYAFYRPFTG
ncbi:Methyltransferase type 11 [Rhodopirellula maiorica SM1]|uniref:Methyltransferase type 11 n=1 Tax=Rhodopirellula maiorica SM1 TaxID=1265738 RepID=M5RF80_9BACT|nr:class I SAM-dependent methyltransferase [Rhodopirellula maiorica]EMI17751.1 Methyltransferase type 11 [Rhodopirellula maiorica SM1]